MSYSVLESELDHLSSNKSLDSILSDSKSLLSGLKSLEKQLASNISKTKDSDLPQNTKQLISNFQENTLKNEKSINKSIKGYSSKIDKLFTTDLTSIYKYDRVEIKDNPHNKALLDRAVTMDLLRNGRFNVIDLYQEDRAFVVPAELADKFRKLNSMLSAIREDNDFAPAIDWATENSKNLKMIGSNLEFNLHKFQYMKLMDTNKSEPYTPFDYAKQNFNKFAGTHLDLISSLLLKLAQNKPEDKKLYTDINMDDLTDQFNHDYCKLMGLSATNSPIFNTLLASFQSIQHFMKYNKIASANLNWTTINELPFEIDLPDDLKIV
ncbi:unnamed protein product [Ambrosiozyma monospora]|uniref:Unnamed protein product n=1 Tax=Ambrosiozyma monospora TaxID=43982 RepID=A0ACB5TX09_AMBMO|nr:unnamed protein product [Ambrosiozyma monospora]